MRKFAKFLIPALLIVAVVIACVVFASAEGKSGSASTPEVAAGETVMYIANVSKGTGDGSSPENAMGHDDGYDPAAKDGTLNVGYTHHAFYKAIMANDQAIVKNGGAIVIVGELTIDTADGMRTSYSEFPWKAAAGEKTITITSAYNGKDFRLAANGGAKLILDTSKVGINLRVNAPTIWEYLNIEAKYDSSRQYGSTDYGVAMISFMGKKAVIDEEVVVTANDIRTTGTKIEQYPALCGYDRMGLKTTPVETNTDITINSGTWGKVYGATYGNGAYGAIKGNVNITVNGGKISQLNCTNGTSSTLTIQVDGNVTANINGGEVKQIHGTNYKAATGTVHVTIGKDVTGLTRVWGSLSGSKYPGSKVTYDIAAASEDIVKYWETVEAVDSTPPPAPSTPEVAAGETVIYIANVSKGSGDGSSPENAMGHDDGYIPSATSYTQHAFYKAIMANDQAIVKNGGAIVIVGELTIDTADGYRTSYSEFPWKAAAGQKTITITSAYNGKDYKLAENGGAKLILDTSKVGINLRVDAPTVWEYLNIEAKYDSSRTHGSGDYGVAMISFMGKKAVIDEEVVVTANDIRTTGTKIEMYPALCGFDRMGKSAPVETNTDITINSGTWGKVYGASYGNPSYPAYGAIKGNVNITINGGKVSQLNCTNGTTSGLTMQVDGNVTANINGGEVKQIHGTNYKAATGTLHVTIGKDVTGLTRVWGSLSGSKYPGSKVTYDKTVVSEDNVKYWETVEAIDNSTPPPPPPPPTPTDSSVIYIANVSKGTGDGSSPENAMGHDANYDPAAKDGTLNVGYTHNAFYKAIMANDQAIVKNGGTIVIVGELTIDTADGYRTSFSEFPWKAAAGEKTITITSKYDGKDYRLAENGGAKLVLDTSKVGINLRMNAPTVWEYLNIEAKYDTSRTGGSADGGIAMISFMGKKAVIDEEVVVTANDIRTTGTKIQMYPILCGYDRMGVKSTPVETDTDITINSGTWGKVHGATYGNASYPQYGAIKGNVNITINGGKISQLNCTNGVYSTALTSQVDGNVTVNINGGEVIQIHGTNYVAATGNLHVTIGKDVTGLTRVWGSPSGRKFPGSKLTYDITAVPENIIFYWETTEPTGMADTGPSVIYIANVSKGTGDGSSPENAMGHDANYDPAAKDGSLNVGYTHNAFYKAIMANMQAIVRNGGTIVIVGELTIDTADGMRTTLSEFPWKANAGSKTITITSKYNNVDYRLAENGGAKLVFDTSKVGINFRVNAPTVWEYINIEAKYNTSRTHGDNDNGVAMLSFFGKKTVFDKEVVVTANDINPGTKIEKYPSICGYDRIGLNSRVADTNTDITINSGTWGKVFGSTFGMKSGTTQYGSIKGNVNITVNGGKVAQLCGTSTPSDSAVLAQVDGNVTININGGEVSALYGTNHVAPTGTITVNISENAAQMTRAWGAYNKETPANSNITYSRKVIRDDNVLYWSNVTANGSLDEQPEKVYYTVYVADVARGKGDGSSPENALGSAPGYTEKYNKMAEILAIPAANRTEAQAAEFEAYKALYKESAFYRALSTTRLLSEDGRLVLVGPTTINASNSLAVPTTNGDFEWPGVGNGVITITSVDKGVDYREQGAKLILDRTVLGVSVNIKSPMIWENLDIEYRYNSSQSTSVGSQTMLAFNGNSVVFGEGINVIPVDVHTTKADSYVNIVGGHRYVTQNGDTNITIKSGIWGTVIGGNYGRFESKKLADGTTEYISHGHKEGNVTITVEGGKITRLIGTCRDDNTVIKPILTGDVNINIKGDAEIVKLYGASRYGIEGKITVNVTEDAYVGEAWGYHYTEATKDAQPKDATLNYVRSAIFEEDIKYWTTVNASGEGQPGVHGPVIYVATTSRGKGDGSSPENALGNAPEYASLRAQALAYVKANGGTNTGLPKDQMSVVTSVYKKSALYLALAKNNNQIIEEGGTIVVCEPLVINAADGMRRSFSEFHSPTSGTKTIKITSVYDGVDYRWKGAKVVLDCTDLGLAVQIKSPTVWDAVVIEHRYNSKNGKGVDNGALIAAAGNKLTMGYCVSSVAVDVNPDEDKRVEIYPSIAGGGRFQDFKQNTHVTINGGQWAMVVGGTWAGPNTGSATIGIGGGKIGTVCGTTKPTATNVKNTITGSVWIGLWAGEVDNVYGVGKNGIKWGSVGVGVGKDIVINGKVYATHPDYEGDEITAIAYYTAGAIDEDKLVGFTTVSPQTGSALIYLSVVALLAIVATGVVISKKRKTLED